MNAWPLSLPRSEPTPARTASAMPLATLAAAMAPVVSHIGLPGFADAALQGLHGAAVRAASWAVYQRWADRPPVLHLSASWGVPDTTRQCFAAYLDGLYQRDRSFDAASPAQAALLRMHADDAPSADHRDAIYRRHGVLERLSVVQHQHDGSLLAVNLYHHDHQGPFSDDEVSGLADLAPLLLSAVQRHVGLTAAPPGGATTRGQAAATSTSTATPTTSATTERRATLARRCPSLTERELDVCERLLRGWSYDGIAADLGLSVATVKTYRARAFDRLGLHFKSELFAEFI